MNHKYFTHNQDGRDFVVGDLHGCFGLLEEALSNVDFDRERDRLFSVGDLIDRGPDSMACLRLVREPWFHSVVGNHEAFLMGAALDGENPLTWLGNGGEWMLEEDPDEIKELAQFIRDNVPYVITVGTLKGKIGICHAQPPTNDWVDTLDPDERTIECMLWARTKVQHRDQSETQGIYRTVHGHTPLDSPVCLGNAVFIDTGAFYTGELTVVNLTSERPLETEDTGS